MSRAEVKARGWYKANERMSEGKSRRRQVKEEVVVIVVGMEETLGGSRELQDVGLDRSESLGVTLALALAGRWSLPLIDAATPPSWMGYAILPERD